MKHGEIWRLATSNFLHAYPVHIYSNMVSLWILGPPLECVSGKQRFCCIYAAGGLAGSITSLLLNPQNTGSMGASGEIQCWGLALCECLSSLSASATDSLDLPPMPPSGGLFEFRVPTWYLLSFAQASAFALGIAVNSAETVRHPEAQLMLQKQKLSSLVLRPGVWRRALRMLLC